MSRVLGVLLMFVLVFGIAFGDGGAQEPNGEALGFYGCTSNGASGDTPGEWLANLATHSWYNDIRLANGGADPTPAQMAYKEHTTYGAAGYQKTPNVGAFLKFFCGNAFSE